MAYSYDAEQGRLQQLLQKYLSDEDKRESLFGDTYLSDVYQESSDTIEAMIQSLL